MLLYIAVVFLFWSNSRTLFCTMSSRICTVKRHGGIEKTIITGVCMCVSPDNQGH
jgi:hypothetical protein